MEAEFAGRIDSISEKHIGSFFCVRAPQGKLFGMVTIPTSSGKRYATLLFNQRLKDKPSRTSLHGNLDRPALIFEETALVPEYNSMEWWSPAGIPDGALILSDQGFMICSDDREDIFYISIRDGFFYDNIPRDVVYFKKWSIFANNRREKDEPLFSMDCDNRE